MLHPEWRPASPVRPPSCYGEGRCRRGRAQLSGFRRGVELFFGSRLRSVRVRCSTTMLSIATGVDGRDAGRAVRLRVDDDVAREQRAEFAFELGRTVCVGRVARAEDQVGRDLLAGLSLSVAWTSSEIGS